MRLAPSLGNMSPSQVLSPYKNPNDQESQKSSNIFSKSSMSKESNVISPQYGNTNKQRNRRESQGKSNYVKTYGESKVTNQENQQDLDNQGVKEGGNDQAGSLNKDQGNDIGSQEK